MSEKRTSKKAPVEGPPKVHIVGTLTIPIENVHANTWNPNKLDQEGQVKLERGMRRLYSESGKLPPIVVRPHPDIKSHWQIIDGQHRWQITKDKLRHKTITVDVINVNDVLAKILTRTFNHLRGEEDEALKAELVADLIKSGESVEELTGLLPENDEELQELLDKREIDVELTKALADAEQAETEEARPKANGDNTFVTLEFMVATGQAEVIEQEVARISELLHGSKNKRGRALEYMAVSSAVTSEEELARILRLRLSAKPATARGTARMVPRVPR